jgi:hypothetical protein
MIVLELTPTNQKSYYGKALVIGIENKVMLKSYDSFVADFDTDKNTLKLNEYAFYSKTTLKHVKDFVKYMNEWKNTTFKYGSKKELLKYLVKE